MPTLGDNNFEEARKEAFRVDAGSVAVQAGMVVTRSGFLVGGDTWHAVCDFIYFAYLICFTLR